jgi:hypothetical protein
VPRCAIWQLTTAPKTQPDTYQALLKLFMWQPDTYQAVLKVLCGSFENTPVIGKP